MESSGKPFRAPTALIPVHCTIQHTGPENSHMDRWMDCAQEGRPGPREDKGYCGWRSPGGSEAWVCRDRDGAGRGPGPVSRQHLSLTRQRAPCDALA